MMQLGKSNKAGKKATLVTLFIVTFMSFPIAVMPLIAQAQSVTGQTRDSLIKNLQDPDSDVRYAAAWALGELGDKTAVQPLIAALNDRNDWVSYAAAWALGELGDKMAVQSLIAALPDNWETHAGEGALEKPGDKTAVQPLIPVGKALRIYNYTWPAAAEALGKIGDKVAVQPLIGALKKSDKSLRINSAESLGKLGDKAAVYPLIKALKEEKDHRIIIKLAEVLGKLGDQAAVQPLIEVLKDDDKAICAAATESLGKLGETAFQSLIAALNDPDKHACAAEVAEVLGKLGDQTAVQSLIRALKDTDILVRANAAKSLGKLGDQTAVKGLITTLNDDDNRVRAAAADALGKLGDKTAVQPLTFALMDFYKCACDVCPAAAGALGKLGDQGAVQPLILALKHDQICARKNAAASLGEFRDQLAVQPLITALKDPDSLVRANTAEALGKLGDQAAVQPLIEVLKEHDMTIRAAATESLGRLGETAFKSLMASLKDPDNWVREGTAKSLGKSGNKAATSQLIAALNDPDKYVCYAAASALGELQDKAAVEPLISSLKSPYKGLRFYAAESLGKLGDKAALYPLIKVMEEEEDERIIIQAVASIVKLGDKAAIRPLFERLHAGRLSNEIVYSIAHALNDLGMLELYGFFYYSAAYDLRDAISTRINEFKLIWNIWAEEGRDTKYVPATHLKPNTGNYSLHIHLSNCEYRKREFPNAKASDELKKLIMEQASLSKESILPLDIIIIPDSYFFYPSPDFHKKMSLDLNMIRQQLEHGYAQEGDPLNVLESQFTLPDFVFGGAYFEGIKTREKEGTGYIGVAIWHDGKPVEDFSLAFCISASGTCKQELPRILSREEAKLIKKSSPRPSGALQFFGLGDKQVAGIFWNEDKPAEFGVWRTNRSPNEFYNYLKDTIIPTFNSTFIDEKLRNYGTGFFNFLFPNKDEGRKIRLEFIEYIKRHISTKPTADKPLPLAGKDPPLLFVRFSENKENLPFIIPVGLMAVDIGNNNKQFIGFHFKLEMPLKNETLSDQGKCITHWIASLPNTVALQNAYRQIGNKSIQDWNSHARICPNIKSFSDWVQEPAEDKNPTAIMVLAHYGDNILTDGNWMLPSASALRRFSQPSVAILNGCGTMKPGATDFIKQLNDNGVKTMIATSTSIQDPMAGDFIQCLGNVIKNIGKEKAKQMTISDVYIRTLNCLHLKKDNHWGPNILRYSILGDGNLSLCPPKKGEGK